MGVMLGVALVTVGEADKVFVAETVTEDEVVAVSLTELEAV